MKMRFKRFLSGFMAVATLASVIVQPVTVSASELEPETTSFEQQYPELQDVQDTLDKDEIVEAKDIEIPYGEEFEVEVDLSGIEGVNEKKVKVLFHEAKSEAGTDFDAHTPDTYKAVYAVEPVSGHPAYRVSRNITVKEPETEAQTKSSSENTVGEGNAGETEDSGNAEEDVDSDESKEIVTDLTDDQEVTTDEESGLTVSEVMDQAENEGIDLYEMEPGETVTFMAAAGNARSSQQVSVTRGAEYRYADYGYGTYLTYQYTVKFGNVSATAYCVQPSKPGPGTGTYTINKVGDGKALAKVCYYGTKASGDDGFFTEENGYGNLSAGARFILVHLAASYANGSSDAFSGANATAQNLAKKLYNYCISQPDIPDVAMSFSDADVTAYVDGNSQRTKEIIFKADELQSITMKLPSGGTLCPTQHRINESAVLTLVSDTLRAIAEYSRNDRTEFIHTVQETQVAQQSADISKKRRRLAAAQKRAGELEKLICKIYEDNALGKLPDARYRALDAQYAKEQDALEIEIVELERAVTGYEQSQKSAEKFIDMIDKYENFDTLTNTMLNEFVEKILVHERARKGSQDTTQEIEIYFNFLGRYIPPSLQSVPLTPEEQEELRKKEERKDRLHQNYLKRKASGAQKQYEDKIKAKKKAEMDAKKALIRAEDMKKGVFSTIGQLPKEEPRKGSIAASAAV